MVTRAQKGRTLRLIISPHVRVLARIVHSRDGRRIPRNAQPGARDVRTRSVGVQYSAGIFETGALRSRGLRVGSDVYSLGSFSRPLVVSIGKAGHTMAETLVNTVGTGLTGIIACPNGEADYSRNTINAAAPGVNGSVIVNLGIAGWVQEPAGIRLRLTGQAFRWPTSPPCWPGTHISISNPPPMPPARYAGRCHSQRAGRERYRPQPV